VKINEENVCAVNSFSLSLGKFFIYSQKSGEHPGGVLGVNGR
jgi:hypothetical protein